MGRRWNRFRNFLKPVMVVLCMGLADAVFADFLQQKPMSGSFNFGGKVSSARGRHRNSGRLQLTLKWSVLCSQVLLRVQNCLSPGHVFDKFTYACGRDDFFPFALRLIISKTHPKNKAFFVPVWMVLMRWRGRTGWCQCWSWVGCVLPSVWVKPSPSPSTGPQLPLPLALLLFKGSCRIGYFGCNQAWPINTEMARIKLIKLSELFPLMSPFIQHKGNSRMNCQRSFALLSRFRRINKLQRSPGAEARSGSGLIKAPLASKISLQHWSIKNYLNILSLKTFTQKKVSFSL